MQPSTRLGLRLVQTRPSIVPTVFSLPRLIHTTPSAPATVSSIHGQGPPPEPPVPETDSAAQRLARRRKQASLLKAAQEIRSNAGKAKKQSQSQQPPLRKRFWKDVTVREVDGALEVHLDTRPLRHPTTKAIIRLPASKPLLAGALAHEWDSLTSVQQASKQHLIPLTSLICRAVDIGEDDDLKGEMRQGIVKMVMRYLDTDSLLCWAPPPGPHDHVEGRESLRDIQKRTSEVIIGFLTTRVWPGIEIHPVLDGESLMPRSHDPVTRQIIEGWVAGLSSWELAGLERAVLAGKGLLGAARLIVEWSEGFVGAGIGDGGIGAVKFGADEAARAASLEVDWQTGNWGEVEDTHDVEKEDIRRQLGGVILLVSGVGKK
ncbi:ATP synthase complex assembly protein atp12 [Neopestalotiopsis sp. 37M]|nr:ATP synthase complex assembly protein atp12 [Neopestalotiopsis sp. 37M]